MSPIVLYGCVNWSHSVREKHSLRVFEYKLLMRICGHKKEEVRERWRKLNHTGSTTTRRAYE
jgi:hypothetical protein